ncbi:MAG: hypothetical protein J6V79_00750 [Bacilli bacterium]|nr:hypothetical protein [Bacilli bacterium]
MKNESKKNIRRVKIASWAAVVLPSIVIGSSLFSRKASEGKEITHEHHHCEDEYLCGASPIDFGGNTPLGIGDFPFNPGPGNGGGNTKPGDLVYEGPKYEGPNLANYHEQPVFVKEYFGNLRNNFPTNDDDNNCGYVAAAMLLSYYDTCWNSSFVPDVFNDDVAELDAIDDSFYESPGVKDYNLRVWTNNYADGPKDEPILVENASEEERRTYEEKKQEYEDWTYGAYELYMERMMSPTVRDLYIIPHLYTIAHQLGIVQYRGEASSGNYDWHRIMPRINLYNLGLVLSKYFENISELTGKVEIRRACLDDYEQDLTDSQKRQKLREDAVERLRQGQPIIYSGDLANSNDGHIGVAYAYDEENDSIIGHIGWKGGARYKTNFDVAFSRFNEFSYLVISDDLRVSENNYRYKVGDMLFESFDLPSHVHNFDKAIHYGYFLKHALQCTCGEVQYELHSLVGRCKCGYKRF